MFNLRFKCTVISSWYMVLHAVPKANKMIANKSSHSAEERFVYAKWIINYMRKHARTRTKVYGRENIPTDSNYIMYPIIRVNTMHWELFSHRRNRAVFCGERSRQKDL